MALRVDYKGVKGYVSISVCVDMYVSFTFLFYKFLYLNFDKNHMGIFLKRDFLNGFLVVWWHLPAIFEKHCS